MRLGFVMGLVGVCGAAYADPCEANIKGMKAGQTFSGEVRHIVDGDGFCVSPSTDPKTWIEVRMADFDSPELSTAQGRAGKEILRGLIAGRVVSCVVATGRNGRSTTNHDRVFAVCSLEGQSIAGRLKTAGAPQGGN